MMKKLALTLVLCLAVFAFSGCGSDGGGSGGGGGNNIILPDRDNYGGYMYVIMLPNYTIHLEDGIFDWSEGAEINLKLDYTFLGQTTPIVPTINSCSFVRKNIDDSIAHSYTKTAVPNPFLFGVDGWSGYTSLTDLSDLLGPLSFNYEVINGVPNITDVTLGEDHFFIDSSTAKVEISWLKAGDDVCLTTIIPFEATCIGSDGFVYQSYEVAPFMIFQVYNVITVHN
jgi:hypothetical protein